MVKSTWKYNLFTIKQVNHGKDDPGKIHQEVFPENLLCSALHQDSWGIWTTSSPKLRAHSSFSLPARPQRHSAMSPKCECNCAPRVYSRHHCNLRPSKTKRPCSMPGLTSSLVSLLTIPHLINWDLAYSGFKTPWLLQTHAFSFFIFC